MKQYVDFHLHSIISQRTGGDSISWHSLEHTINQINSQKIKAFAFTDHDGFDCKTFFDSKKIIESKKFNIKIFFGVELSITKKNGTIGHIVFIFDNQVNDEKIRQLSRIIKENVSPKIGISISKFINAITNYKYIMIPHVGKGHNDIDFIDISEYVDQIKYVEVLSNSKKNMNKYDKYVKHSNTKPIAIKFSDNHKWKESTYIKPKTYVDVEGELTFDNIFNNLKEDN